MRSKRVLIVDDDPDIRDYFGSFLEDNDYEVSAVPDADSALETAASFEPDVILIDALMPGRSGLDLLVALRRHERFGEIPLVVITGSDKILEDDCQTYLGFHDGVRGPDGVLGKPIDRQVLLTILSHLSEDEPRQH